MSRDDPSFGSYSRRFQLSVVLLTVLLVILSAIAVSSVATTSPSVGLTAGGGPAGPSIGGVGSGSAPVDGNTTGTPTGEGNGTSEATRTPGEGTATSNQEGESGEGVGVPGTVRGRLPGMNTLDAGSQSVGVPSDRSVNVTLAQLSNNTGRSFIENTEFFAQTEDTNVSYYRAASYSTYENGSFTQPRSSQDTAAVGDSPPPYVEEVTSQSSRQASDQRVVTRFRLTEPASRLPVPWYPVSVELTGGADPSQYAFQQRENGAVIVTDEDGNPAVLPAGAEYTVTSVPPPQGDRLRGAGGAPSSEVYTTVPDSVPDRVSELGREIERESGADTRYEKTQAVVQWLQSNKEYRANTTTPQDSPVDTFLFERDGGHGEYFASSATLLLRSQGVPARYVTGYAGGELTNRSDGLYRVGSSHRTAWVEVYYDKYGWVRVDPTPREQARKARRAVQAGAAAAKQFGVSPKVIQQVGEGADAVTSDSGPTVNESLTGGDGEPEFPAPPYNISVTPDPAPGKDVTVRVTKNGTPVRSIQVFVNGESVGRTNSVGEISITVPYAEQLTISVGTGESQPLRQDVSAREVPVGVTADITTSALRDSAVRFSLRDPGIQLQTGGDGDTSQTTTENGSSRTFDLPTNVTVSPSGYVFPGESVTAAVDINGTPVPGATVRVNGQRVGETGPDGEIQFTIPDSVTPGGVMNVTVQRDKLTSHTTVEVSDVVVRAEPKYLPLPMLPATVSVDVTGSGDGDSSTANATGSSGVSNATVFLYTEQRDPSTVNADGSGAWRRVTTGADGTATVTLPVSNHVTAVTTVYGESRASSIGNIFIWTGGVVVVLLGLVAGIAYAVYTYGVPVEAVAEKAMGVLFAVSESLQSIGRVVLSFARRAWTRLRDAARSLRDGITRAKLAALASWVVSVVLMPVYWIVTQLRALINAVLNRGDETSDSDSLTSESLSGMRGDVTSQSAYERLLRAWRWLLQLVTASHSRSTVTAAEVGDMAVEKGFPERPVRRLQRAFQDVEYGQKPVEPRADSAEQAVTDIQPTTSGNADQEMDVDVDVDADSDSTGVEAGDESVETQQEGT